MLNLNPLLNISTGESLITLTMGLICRLYILYLLNKKPKKGQIHLRASFSYILRFNFTKNN